MDANFGFLLSTYLAHLRNAFDGVHNGGDSIPKIERLPLPKADQLRTDLPGKVLTHHPLSGMERWIQVEPITSEQIDGVIHDLTDDITDPRLRFLVVWRRLSDRLAQISDNLLFYPAELRAPDVTIWHHADAVTALVAATDRRALLSFNLGPVQSFIAAARSVRDLWSGSAILSWLTFPRDDSRHRGVRTDGGGIPVFAGYAADGSVAARRMWPL